MSDVVRECVDLRGTTGLLLVGATDSPTTACRLKTSSISISACLAMHWANVFKMGSSTALFDAKSCTCAFIAFLAGILSLAIDYASA